MNSKIRHWPYYGLLLFVFIIVYPYVFNSKLFLGGDNASYFSLAKAIAAEFRYVDFFSPNPLPANHFPPGYPFILAIAIKCGVTTLQGLKITSGLFLFGSSLLTYKVGFQLLKHQVGAFLIAVATLLNMHLLEFASITMSEVPFMFFVLLTFYAFIRFVETDYRMKSIYFALSLIGVVAVVYIRTQGIAILGAFVFFLLLQKQWKIMLIMIGFFCVTYGPWQIRSASLGGSSYAKQLFRVDAYNANSAKMKAKDWGERISKNVSRYSSKEMASIVFPVVKTVYNDPKNGNEIPASPLQWVLGLSSLLLCVFGMWKIKKWRWLLFSFFGANFIIFILWPQVWFGVRFILPLTPLILILLCAGIKFAIQMVISKPFVESGKIYPVIVLLLIFVNFPTVKAMHEKAEGKYPANWANYLYVAEWAKDNLKDSDVVVTRKPELFAFLSEKKSKTYLYSDQIDSLKADFSRNKVTHVVLEQLGFTQTSKYLVPFINKEPDRFELMYTIGYRDGVDAKGNKAKTLDGVWVYIYHPEFGYTGKYVNGLKEGFGTYAYANGNVFEGTWKNDTIVGKGVYKQLDGQTLSGVWEKGKRNGKFVITNNKDKTLIYTNWNMDVMDHDGFITDTLGRNLRDIRFK